MLSQIYRMLARQLLFAFLALGIASGLAWYAMPQLAAVTAAYLLKGSNVELVALELERQTRLPLLVSDLTLRTSTTLIRMQGISLKQLTPLAQQWQLEVDKLEITTLPDIPAGQDTTLADWQAQLLAARPWLPERGEIRHYAVCPQILGADCLSGKLSWRTRAAVLVADIEEWRTAVAARVVLPERASSLATIALTSIARPSDRPDSKPLPFLDIWLPRLFSADISLDTGASTPAPGADEALLLAGRLTLGPTAISWPATNDLLISDRGILSRASGDITKAEASFTLTLPMSTLLASADLQAASHLQIDARAEGLWQVAVGTLTASSQTPLAVQLDIAADGSTLQLTETLTASLSEPRFNNTSLTIAAGSRCSGQMQQDMQCDFPTVHLQGSMTNSPYGLHGSLAKLALTRQADLWTATATTDVGVTDNHGALLQVNGEIKLTPAGLHLTSNKAQVLGLPLQRLAVDQPLGGGDGVLQAALATSLRNVARSRALQLDLPLGESLQTDTGTVAAQLQLRWQLEGATPRILGLQSNITFKAAGFEFDHYRVAGLDATLALAGWPRIVSTTPVELNIKTLDLGVPLTNLRTTFALAADLAAGDIRIDGEQMQLQLLGGTATSNSFWLEPLHGNGFAQFDLASLALQQILALERDDFASSGYLSGSVPVHLNGGKVSVTDGQLKALPPGGFIRYTPDTATLLMLTQSDKTKMLVDTLSDFQYHDLQVALNYSAAGDLLAKTAIRGNNPLYQNGREIHFNLAIEENIGTLLRSLRMGDTVTRKVQNRSEHLPPNRK
jgi:hypothetical protein